ncbi:MAG: hypothetical protein IJF27_00130, partial [Oscillospiraceae bacterium]|nr:hypothetical protein [Oscillospiraceae bacterium]
ISYTEDSLKNIVKDLMLYFEFDNLDEFVKVLIENPFLISNKSSTLNQNLHRNRCRFFLHKKRPAEHFALQGAVTADQKCSKHSLLYK